MSLLMPWPGMGAPNSCFFIPFLETQPPHPRAIGCLYPFQVLTEAAMFPRLPLVSCLSVRLSLRTERLQEASFLPPSAPPGFHPHTPNCGLPFCACCKLPPGVGCILPVPSMSKLVLSCHPRWVPKLWGWAREMRPSLTTSGLLLRVLVMCSPPPSPPPP